MLELQQLGVVPTALRNPFHAQCPLAQTLSLTPSCPSPDSSMPFPQALLLSQSTELPVRSCSRQEASPQLLCSGLHKLKNLSCSCTVPSRLCTTFVAPLCTPSSGFMSLHCAIQTCPQHRAEQDSPVPHQAGSARRAPGMLGPAGFQGPLLTHIPVDSDDKKVCSPTLHSHPEILGRDYSFPLNKLFMHAVQGAPAPLSTEPHAQPQPPCCSRAP